MCSVELPYIIAGPVMRRLEPKQLVIWLVTREPLQAELALYQGEMLLERRCSESITQTVQIGEHAYINLLDCRPTEPLPVEEWLSYELTCKVNNESKTLAELLPHLLYDGEVRPRFVLKTQLDQVLHGSCRKPHYRSDDALLRVDELLQCSQNDLEARPALLLMTGDQIYADDVAGPMLTAIHEVIRLLKLAPEAIEGASVASCEELYQSEFCYYQREKLLPHTVANEALKDMFFGGGRKPIFTANTVQNHLITLAEVLAMYLLVWSPQLWSLLKFNSLEVEEPFRERYLAEQDVITAFASELGPVQRALAHVPVYMIFDDHDITDDWNLTRGWESAAYNHPFSRRIIGNALIGYWLCQGWGNAPEKFPDAWQASLNGSFQEGGEQAREELISQMLGFRQWHYSLATQPRLLVLDTRTQRWWSESSQAKPSGLMDWEALSDLQQELIGEDAVLLVSPAPIFGMKLVEAVQRIFVFFGHALMVDAENWMAHPGSANVILNIFLHMKTPQNFVILSGDVHYSFAYDIKIRHRLHSPEIWQITCSGFKNEFPHRLLKGFDRANRWLYGSSSPLNWFTKRRKMQIRSRIPSSSDNDRVVNKSAVGRVMLNKQGEPTRISILPATGGEIYFPER